MEELSSEVDYQHLAQEDERSNEQETLAATQVQGGTACGKGTGIKHVPKLQHHEDGEEGCW